jgi:hypothetical protein
MDLSILKNNKSGGILAFIYRNWLLIAIVLIVIIFGKPLFDTIKTMLAKVTGAFDNASQLLNDAVDATGLKNSATQELSYKNSADSNNPLSPSYYKAAPAGAHLFHYADACKMATDINNSFGYLTTDFNTILGTFKQCDYKSQVSFLADVYYHLFSSDLSVDIQPASFLGGWFYLKHRLNDDGYKQINDYVNSLQDY